LVLAVPILTPQKVATDLILFLVREQSPILLLQAVLLHQSAAAVAVLLVVQALTQIPQVRTVVLVAALRQVKGQLHLAARQRPVRVITAVAAALTSLDLLVAVVAVVLALLVLIRYLARQVVGARGLRRVLQDRLLLTLAAVAVGIPAAVQ
jgi:hypothetical protein